MPVRGLELLAVLVRRARGDPVDHGVGERDVPLDPVGELGVLPPRVGGDHRVRHVTVALDVVAGHHGEGPRAVVAAAAQRLDDVAEGGARGSAGVGGDVGLDRRVAVVELPGARALVVAALGDGEADDPRRRVGHAVEHGAGIVGGVEVVDDRADHLRLAPAVGVLEHEGVEVVLRLGDLGHPLVGLEDADPADAPVQGLAPAHELVDVHRLVRPVEPAHPEVHDADRHRAAVVGRTRDIRGQIGQGRRRQRRCSHPATMSCDGPCAQRCVQTGRVARRRSRPRRGRVPISPLFPSSIRDATVSAASRRFTPMPPPGPRLIQPTT